MRVLEILPDFFFIQRGFLNGNHFVYRSEKPILVDSGYVSGFAKTVALINGTGADINKTSLIINTHCHCDHIGGNKLIQQASGCRIALHKIGKYFIDMRDKWSTWWSYYVQEADFFDCQIELEDEDDILIGPYEFKVIYTPGHASDGIVLYNHDHRLLISSDTLWEYDMAVMTTRIEGSRALFCMLESIDRISKLTVETIYPGHGSEFKDFDGAINRARSRLLRFLKDPSLVGHDLIKKIIVYTIMMRRAVNISTFFDYLMQTPWYVETVDLYFSGDYSNMYKDALDELIKKEIVHEIGGHLSTTVTP